MHLTHSCVTLVDDVAKLVSFLVTQRLNGDPAAANVLSVHLLYGLFGQLDGGELQYSASARSAALISEEFGVSHITNLCKKWKVLSVTIMPFTVTLRYTTSRITEL